MGDLSDFLKNHKRSFPIGLSGMTGMGYILTGGISPLSRSKGLAIDQIEKINGFWGNGKEFHLSRPKTPNCLLYTSPSPRDRTRSRMPSSA